MTAQEQRNRTAFAINGFLSNDDWKTFVHTYTVPPHGPGLGVLADILPKPPEGEISIVVVAIPSRNRDGQKEDKFVAIAPEGVPVIKPVHIPPLWSIIWTRPDTTIDTIISELNLVKHAERVEDLTKRVTKAIGALTITAEDIEKPRSDLDRYVSMLAGLTLHAMKTGDTTKPQEMLDLWDEIVVDHGGDIPTAHKALEERMAHNIRRVNG